MCTQDTFILVTSISGPNWSIFHFRGKAFPKSRPSPTAFMNYETSSRCFNLKVTASLLPLIHQSAVSLFLSRFTNCRTFKCEACACIIWGLGGEQGNSLLKESDRGAEPRSSATVTQREPSAEYKIIVEKSVARERFPF